MISQTLHILADAPPTPSPWGQVPFIIAMVLIFYVLLIRPQQKRQKDLQNLVQNIKTGDKVVTNGGIHGIVSNIKDGPTLMLKVADNVKLEVDKSAIASVDRGTANSAPAPAAISNS